MTETRAARGVVFNIKLLSSRWVHTKQTRHVLSMPLFYILMERWRVFIYITEFAIMKKYSNTEFMLCLMAIAIMKMH